jgi:hypothetical protein
VPCIAKWLILSESPPIILAGSDGLQVIAADKPAAGSATEADITLE